MMLSELMERLTSLRGISGWEEDVQAEIARLIEPGASSLSMDVNGNLIAEKKGLHPSAKKLLFSAHMDEGGFLVSHIEENGMLRLTPVGTMFPALCGGRRVEIGPNHLPGVIGCQPIHLIDREARGKYLTFDQLQVDIGASTREEAEQKVSLGMPVTFAGSWSAVGELRCAQALDSRIGCALLVKMIQDTLPNDADFVFSVQGQTGFLGAQTAAFSLHPDLAIVVDAMPAEDLPQVAEAEQICKIGGGPVLSILDRATLYDRRLFQTAQRVAAREQIPLQYASIRTQSGEGYAYQRTGTGCPVLSVAVPVRYPHSESCMVSLEDANQTLRLLKALTEELSQ